MIARGFVTLPRAIAEVWRQNLTAQERAVALELLLRVRWKPGDDTWHGITVPHGGCVIGQEAFAADCGVSRIVVRSALRKLADLSQLTASGVANRATLVCFVNYSRIFTVAGTGQPTGGADFSQPAANRQPGKEERKNGRRKERRARAHDGGPKASTGSRGSDPRTPDSFLVRGNGTASQSPSREGRKVDSFTRRIEIEREVHIEGLYGEDARSEAHRRWVAEFPNRSGASKAGAGATA